MCDIPVWYLRHNIHYHTHYNLSNIFYFIAFIFVIAAFALVCRLSDG